MQGKLTSSSSVVAEATSVDHQKDNSLHSDQAHALTTDTPRNVASSNTGSSTSVLDDMEASQSSETELNQA
jgi:hypothetical protein